MPRSERARRALSTRWRRSVGVGAAVAASLLTTAPAGATGHSRSARLAVTVVSVDKTLTDYTPGHARAGIPTEVVAFTVANPSGATVRCTVAVVHHGRRVGSTVATARPAVSRRRLQHLDVTVTVSGPTFAGRPSDARVVCRRQ